MTQSSVTFSPSETLTTSGDIFTNDTGTKQSLSVLDIILLGGDGIIYLAPLEWRMHGLLRTRFQLHRHTIPRQECVN